MNRAGHYLLLTLATLAWGGNQVVAKVGLREASPLTLATLRLVLMAAVLVLLAWAGGASLRFRAADWRQFGWLGLTGVFGFNLLLLSGLRYTSAAEGGLIQAASPVIGGYLGWRFRGERMTPVRMLAMALSAAGVVLVVAAGRPLPDVTPARRLLGDLLVLGATVAWAVYTLSGKEVMARHSPLTATAMAAVTGAAMFLVTALLPGAPPVVAEAAGLSRTGWLAVAYMVVVSGAGGSWAWYRGLRGVEVGTASTFLNLLPVWTVVLSGVFLGEEVTPLQLVGGAAVVVGCLLNGLG